jgi:MFS family permease
MPFLSPSPQVVSKPIWKAILMWGLPLLFFAYQFILRLWPSLTMQSIMEQYHIDATAFGLLSAVYYIGYAGMQIPVALLLDRFSLRYIVAAFALLAGGAALIFTYADHWVWALIGRFLIGVASAAGFLGTSKAVSLWFSHDRYARMIGFTFSFGLLGALYGGRPVNAMIEGLGVTDAAQKIALAGMIIGGVIMLLYRDPHHQKVNQEKVTFCLHDLKQLLTQPSLIVLACANLLMVGALEGFADIWGVTFLVTSYAIPKDTAAGIVSFIYIGMLFGGPVLAFFSERLGGIKVIMASGMGIALLLGVILFGCRLLSPLFLQVFLFIVGMLCCYQVVIFATSADFVSSQQVGITVAFMNCVNMLGGFFFHALIGYVADLFWSGEMLNGCRIYSSEAYTYALLIIPACALLGGLLVPIAQRWR